jgi:N-acetyl-anhydromuramyl-L-alanine amidase AmpD
MTQSPEYPDLPFVVPAHWAYGRDGYSVQFIVVHYTAGSERSTSAEDGAAYDQRRADSVSTHYFVDSDSVVQCVQTRDRAYAALYNGNRKGIQYELCGTQQTRAQWLDPASNATLWNAAKQMARDCRKYGIPVVHLTPAQARAGAKGIAGHDTCTLAWPEDNGDHMDPGSEFPWDILLQRINTVMTGQGVNDVGTIDDPLQAAELQNTEHYLQAIFNLNDKAVAISNTQTASDMPSPFTAAFKKLMADVASIKATMAASQTVQPTLSDAEVDRIAAAVVARPDNPLGDADKPAIKAALAELLLGGLSQPSAPSGGTG